MKISKSRFIISCVIGMGIALGAVMYPLINHNLVNTKATLTVVGQATVPVRCRVDLATAVAAGKYRTVNQYIGEDEFPSYHFACKDSEKVMYFIAFNKGMKRDETIRRLDMAGFRPADLYELLALGELHSASYSNATIVALGSSMKDMDLSPYLYNAPDERDIGLHGDGECDIVGCNEFLSFGYRWHPGDLFLAVQK